MLEATDEQSSNLSTSESMEDSRGIMVEVPDAMMMGNGVVFYRVVSQITRPDGVVSGCCHRRFSEFVLFFRQLKASFSQSNRRHLVSSLPKPPPKQAKVLHDHHSAVFIESRRVSLEQWLRRLLMVPGLSDEPEMVSFLGATGGGLREVSVVFPDPRLGIRLMRPAGRDWEDAGNETDAPRPRAVVADFLATKTGRAGRAQLSGLIGIGDCVSKVQGESVLTISFEEIIERIRVARRPLLLHFLGHPLPVAATPQS